MNVDSKWGKGYRSDINLSHDATPEPHGKTHSGRTAATDVVVLMGVWIYAA